MISLLLEEIFFFSRHIQLSEEKDNESNRTKDHYIPAELSSLSAILSMIMSTFILTLVWKSKVRLHIVNHLLICNTYLASIFYCIVTITMIITSICVGYKQNVNSIEFILIYHVMFCQLFWSKFFICRFSIEWREMQRHFRTLCSDRNVMLKFYEIFLFW